MYQMLHFTIYTVAHPMQLQIDVSEWQEFAYYNNKILNSTIKPI